MSSEYKYCSVDIKTTNAQESIKGGIVVAVTGCLTTKNNVQRNFSQTFFLAKQEKGFFVLNDILQFCCVCEPSTKAAPTQDSGVVNLHSNSICHLLPGLIYSSVLYYVNNVDPGLP